MEEKGFNKQFEHKGIKFNINVKLYEKIERSPRGSAYHQITIKTIDTQDYSQMYWFEKKNYESFKSNDFVTFLANCETLATNWVDSNKGMNDTVPVEQICLASLGFVKSTVPPESR